MPSWLSSTTSTRFKCRISLFPMILLIVSWGTVRWWPFRIWCSRSLGVDSTSPPPSQMIAHLPTAQTMWQPQPLSSIPGRTSVSSPDGWIVSWIILKYLCFKLSSSSEDSCLWGPTKSSVPSWLSSTTSTGFKCCSTSLFPMISLMVSSLTFGKPPASTLCMISLGVNSLSARSQTKEQLIFMQARWQPLPILTSGYRIVTGFLSSGPWADGWIISWNILKTLRFRSASTSEGSDLWGPTSTSMPSWLSSAISTRFKCPISLFPMISLIVSWGTVRWCPFRIVCSRSLGVDSLSPPQSQMIAHLPTAQTMWQPQPSPSIPGRTSVSCPDGWMVSWIILKYLRFRLSSFSEDSCLWGPTRSSMPSWLSSTTSTDFKCFSTSLFPMTSFTVSSLTLGKPPPSTLWMISLGVNSLPAQSQTKEQLFIVLMQARWQPLPFPEPISLAGLSLSGIGSSNCLRSSISFWATTSLFDKNTANGILLPGKNGSCNTSKFLLPSLLRTMLNVS